MTTAVKTFHHSRATKFQKLQLQDFSTFVILDWINASVQWSQIDFILENNSETTGYFGAKFDATVFEVFVNGV